MHFFLSFFANELVRHITFEVCLPHATFLPKALFMTSLALTPHDSETPSSSPTEADRAYQARLESAQETDFSDFEKKLVLTINEANGLPAVVFTPRAAGEKPNMDLLLNYLIFKLHNIVLNGSYILIYCHTGMSYLSRKHFAWLKEAYGLLGRKYKKNIQRLVVVHPSMVLSAGFLFARPFLSKKFWVKLRQVSKVGDVEDALDCVGKSNLEIPSLVYQSEGVPTIQKRRYFGADIETQALGFNGVPVVLEELTRALLMSDSLSTHGIFRVPGNASEIDVNRRSIEMGQQSWTEGVLLHPEHQHIFAGLMKLYFRELPHPVIPFDCYQPLVELVKQSASDDTVAADAHRLIHASYEKLGLVEGIGLRTLWFLLGILSKFQDESHVNNMTAKNLSIVFAPNIIRAPPQTSPMVEAQQIVHSNRVIEILITGYRTDTCPHRFDYTHDLVDHGIGIQPLLNVTTKARSANKYK